MTTLLFRMLRRQPAPALAAFELGMLEKLPVFDPAWSDEVREGWQRCAAIFTAKLSA